MTIHIILTGLISHFAGVVNGIACYPAKRLGFARECSNRSGDGSFTLFLEVTLRDNCGSSDQPLPWPDNERIFP